MNQIGKKLYAAWMKFAHVLAFVNTRIILTIMYILVIGPIALFHWLLRKDPLDRKLHEQGTYWRTREKSDPSLESVRRQF